MSNNSSIINSTEQTKDIAETSMVDLDIQIAAKADPEVQEKYIFVSNKPVGRHPVAMKCPHCYKDIVTIIDYSSSARTHTCCLILTVLGCALCAPCVYCSDDCRAKEHYCPKCYKFLGSYDG